MFIYAVAVFLLYPCGARTPESQQKTAHQESAATASEGDIMGKSSFDVNAELRRIRQAKEETARKAAVAKGEITEDGKEIAQEVKPEDCEFEQKKVWKQVPPEEIKAMFDEPEEPGEPHASGMTINDIDLAFNNLQRDDLTEEEACQTVAVFKNLEGTELLDEVEKQFSEVGMRIDELIDRIATKEVRKVVVPDSFEDFKPSDYL